MALKFEPQVQSSSSQVKNPQSNKVLDVSGGDTDNGTNVHLWESNNSGAQIWVIEANGTIRNPQSNKVLDVSG
eukprot:gene21375-27692_t